MLFKSKFKIFGETYIEEIAVNTFENINVEESHIGERTRRDEPLDSSLGTSHTHDCFSMYIEGKEIYCLVYLEAMHRLVRGGAPFTVLEPILQI